MHDLLAVRAWAPGGDRHLPIEDLTFTKTAPGGHADAGFRLPMWVTATDPALGPLARVKVYDTRTGATVWGAGFLDMPGKTVAADGHSWDVGVIGPTSLLTDRALAHIVVDQLWDGWRQQFASNSGMSAGAGSHPSNEDVDAFVLAYPNGAAVGFGSRVSAHYLRLKDAGQLVGGFRVTHVEGLDSLGQQLELLIYPVDGGAGSVAMSRNWTTTKETILRSAGQAGFPVNGGEVKLRAMRSRGAINVRSDTWWSAVTVLRVSGQRRNQDGNPITGADAYSSDTVLAHEVVIDALWRYTTLIDIPNADIAAGSYGIDQLAYPDPVHAVDMLADLALFEPDLYHYVGASDDTTNQHSFAYRGWGVDARYEADTVDGWTEPGGDVDLCNRVAVSWTDKAGRAQSTVVTAAVAELDALGRVREAEPVDLGGELGSGAAAVRIGERVLTRNNTERTHGTLTVARPIRDLTTGRMVLPHEIEPGYRIRVRDLGLTTRLSEMTYRASDQSAALTLGRPAGTRDQLLTRIQHRRERR